MGVFRESVQEQPPSFSNSPAVPGLAEERARAPEGRKRKVKERRAGTTTGAPAAALEHRVRGPSRGDAGEQKLRPFLTCSGVVLGAGVAKSGGAGSSPPSVLRSCAFGAAPLLRAGFVPLPAPGRVSALGGSATLLRRTGFLTFRLFLAPLSCPW